MENAPKSKFRNWRVVALDAAHETDPGQLYDLLHELLLAIENQILQLEYEPELQRASPGAPRWIN